MAKRKRYLERKTRHFERPNQGLYLMRCNYSNSLFDIAKVLFACCEGEILPELHLDAHGRRRAERGLTKLTQRSRPQFAWNRWQRASLQAGRLAPSRCPGRADGIVRSCAAASIRPSHASGCDPRQGNQSSKDEWARATKDATSAGGSW